MAKPKRSKTLAEQLADLDGPAPKDFDPEEPDTFASGSDDSESGEDNTVAAREHYVEVGESKLRKKDAAPLGPKYKGSRVTRDAIEDDESDDPLSKGFEDGSDEEDGDDLSQDGTGTEDEENDEENSDFSDEDEEEKEDGSGSSDEDEEMDGAKPNKGAFDRSELRKIVSEEQKTVAATLSEAARADAEKGRAVKTQRKTFDSLLNTRIRLQKALVATNSMVAQQAANTDGSSDGHDDPVRAAEEAACNLWNTLNDLRESLYISRTGEKRKRVEISTSTPVQEAWIHMNSYEDASVPHRQVVMEKWNAKARGVSALSTKSKLNNTAQQGLIDVLASQLADSTRLVQKTRMPRSCAPVQANAGVTESAEIFDDADFYGLLLKELLERRSEESASGALAGMSFNVPHWQAAREAKTKKHVDTRASKGRKLRYTVHEKLQNFMAPEDRGSWGERQAEELFTGLLGRKVGLTEDAVEEAERSEDEDLGEQGLLLFGGSK
ncbi:apoptosis-antagonizing transcription factor [Phyllosticta citribraziliensis]|uniref:Protein BFR2 n=1 Tax=Phyllosticta citribraziliensis TaxID=989973 RepID=A0ABR1LIC4_9PEZI